MSDAEEQKPTFKDLTKNFFDTSRDMALLLTSLGDLRLAGEFLQGATASLEALNRFQESYEDVLR